MFQYIARYEWMTLLRDKWVLILSILFLSITLFAIHNGKQKVNDRAAAIEKERIAVAEIDARFKAEIDSINRSLKPAPKESWRDPRALDNFAWEGKRLVAMDPQPLALVSTGQSDLFTHYVRPRIYGETYMLGFSELSNPVQLLFGNFDLAFVCIYLLPLLILAFSYNIFSSEKESGVVRLIAAQPISLFRWLLNRVLFRFVVLSAVVVISILITLVIYQVNVFGNVWILTKMILGVLVYMLFWFLLALAVNLRGQSSGKNAIALVSMWVVIVLLIPSVISQTANTIYPVPSRVAMIHQYRQTNADAEKRANEILKSYLREHPELAPKDTTQVNQYDWWLGYYASSDIVNQAVRPVLKRYDEALAQQQAWVDNLRFLSPAILIQYNFNELAGTSAAHYADFRQQAIAFADEWKGYFRPRMFNNERMQATDIDSLPRHTYSTKNVKTQYGSNILGLLILILVIGVITVAMSKTRQEAGILAG